MFGACDVFACRDQGRSCATPRMRWIGGPRAGGTAGFVRLIENCSVCSTAFAVSTCNQCKAEGRSRHPAIPTRAISMPNPIRNFRVWLSRPWSPAQSARVLAFGPPLPPAVRSAPPLRPPRAHTSLGTVYETPQLCRGVVSAPAGRAGRGGSLWSVGSRLGPRASHGHAPPFSITPPCTAASQT